ncbi:hypothetical protein conserved [Leishmania donovani]|uniref:Hypothetical_protein_conserved n=1 Tax=Leishmania donovani TaxID=5661 RepID=A0A3S5H5G9_LEIDO|nr:hypothetical protein LdCL_050007600 [Leishmania donovani]CAJ1985998.1 hypothetical protein conserved [Leishmania donovani]VDZ41900.1 hypothetical_protein_conserved [Leishmania donovani]
MAETAGEEDVRRMSREERIASYRELVEGLDDILASHDADGDNDGEDAEQMAALVEEVEVQLRTLAQLLNEEETIQVTPGLMKKVEKSPETGEVLTTIIYPPPSMPNTASSSPALRPAPYEVLFDERDWYPCVITGVVPPAKDVDRVQYKAWILGHNVEEIVYSEALRPWQPTASTSDIQGGVSCHVIDPQTGRYVEGVVDRLTLEETVLVKVPVAPSTSTAVSESPSAATTTTTVTVPLSHVRVGKFYSQLRHRPKTEEERAVRRAERARLKRERAAQQRQMAADKVAKDADDWQALIGDMMGVGSGGGGGKKHKRRRLQ